MAAVRCKNSAFVWGGLASHVLYKFKSDLNAYRECIEHIVVVAGMVGVARDAQP